MKDTILLLAMNGLIWGLIIALIALGLSVIFGLLDIIRLSQGQAHPAARCAMPSCRPGSVPFGEQQMAAISDRHLGCFGKTLQ